jgi:recombination protein RecA
MARRRLNDSDYYPQKNSIEFVKTGCALLDCVIGGGWPLGRISNIVGDKAVGKTLLAIEGCANFARQYPEGLIKYREAEAAFDKTYAATLGLPIDRVDFGKDDISTQWETMEEIAADLDLVIEEASDLKQPCFYIIDSLDALSSIAELERDFEAGSYGLEKQKGLGKIFRTRARKLKQARVGMLIISQIRDKIGVSFGDKHTRTGGRAMDFYASIALWLSSLGMEYKTVKGIKRPYAINIKAKCKKNKISMPFRECDFPILFGYGIDELAACIGFLEQAKATGQLEGYDKKYLAESSKLDDAEYKRRLIAVRRLTRTTWREVEEGFAPTRRKYA